MTHYDLPIRLKRLRQTPVSRALIREIRLHPEQLIAPLFVHEGLNSPREIASMPGQFQLSLQDLPREIDQLSRLGIHAVLLFGIPVHKDEQGSAALEQNSIIARAIRSIKQHNPNMLVITDVCFCEYTSHGHCGMLDHSGQCINNDATLLALTEQALCHARAGVDWVAPSGMVDGMVGAIRTALDAAGYAHVAILSYSVKYCSAMYGPFREAAQGAPQFGDRRAYQMDPANKQESLREAALDIQEGADVIMVKPALHYLDIIHQIKTTYPHIPLCAYQVSGEYSLIKYGAREGLLDEQLGMLESLTAIQRAGANMIITYFAKNYAQYYTNYVQSREQTTPGKTS